VRRFDRAGIEDVVRAAGLEVLRLDEMNRLGTIGWRIHHALGGGRISASEARAFDWMVPLARFLEPLLPGHGLSILVVARVP
jgi:hypothetical protein